MSPSMSPGGAFADFHSRRLSPQTRSISSVPPAKPTLDSSFDWNTIMIITILLCALISSLIINTLVRCAIRCSSRTERDTDDDDATRHRISTRRKELRPLSLINYSAGLKLPGSATGECAICISEFVAGDKIRVLPACNHGFHVRCVDRWLLERPSCPTCRRCLFSSCQKVSQCAEVSRPGTGTAQSTIVPLEPEGVVSR